jgi:hypothetical protein
VAITIGRYGCGTLAGGSQGGKAAAGAPVAVELALRSRKRGPAACRCRPVAERLAAAVGGGDAERDGSPSAHEPPTSVVRREP